MSHERTKTDTAAVIKRLVDVQRMAANAIARADNDVRQYRIWLSDKDNEIKRLRGALDMSRTQCGWLSALVIGEFVALVAILIVLLT